MKKNRICMWLFLLFFTLSTTANGLTIRMKPQLSSMLNNADFIIVGKVSEVERILDKQAQVTCGSLHTLEQVKILWLSAGVSDSLIFADQKTRIRSIGRPTIEGNVLVIGRFPRSNDVAPKTLTLFDTEILKSADLDSLDLQQKTYHCEDSALLSSGYRILFTAPVNTIEIYDGDKSGAEKGRQIDYIAMDVERLIDISGKGSNVNDTLMAGIIGWKSDLGKKMIVCVTPEMCRSKRTEMFSIITLHDSKKIKFFGGQYFIKIDKFKELKN